MKQIWLDSLWSFLRDFQKDLLSKVRERNTGHAVDEVMELTKRSRSDINKTNIENTTNSEVLSAHNAMRIDT